METINLTTAKEMVARYATTRKTLIDDTYGINDTKSSWIPIDEFTAFINNLPSTATGIRIHLATHGNDYAPAPNQTTIVIIGTVNDGTSDIDSINSNSVLLAISGLDPTNHTKDCPPNC